MALLFDLPKIILSLLFLYINIYLQIHHISAQPLPYFCNNKIGNYSKNSNFQANLNTILSSVSSDINTYGFYNGTIGDGVDQVNAIALCRGDVDIELCRSCVKDAAQNLTVLCPNQKEAIVWFDYCEFRYSNNRILGVMSLDPSFLLENANNATNVTMFSQELHSLADVLVNEAYNGSLRKYAGMKSNNPKSNAQTVYGYMQCTPDLTPADCMSCLNTIANYLSICCYNRLGVRAYSPSCSFRYEIYPFLNQLSNQPPQSPLSPSSPPMLPSSPPPPLSPSSPPPPTSPSPPSPVSPSSSPLPSSQPPPQPPISPSSPQPPISPTSPPLLPSSPPPHLSPLSQSTPPPPTSKGSATRDGQIFVVVMVQVFCYYFFQFGSHLIL